MSKSKWNRWHTIFYNKLAGLKNLKTTGNILDFKNLPYKTISFLRVMYSCWSYFHRRNLDKDDYYIKYISICSIFLPYLSDSALFSLNMVNTLLERKKCYIFPFQEAYIKDSNIIGISWITNLLKQNALDSSQY